MTEQEQKAFDQMREALETLLRRDKSNTCQHEETHRGGVIWEICEECGMKWADDRGGKPKWKNPPEWDAAESALTAANAVSHPQATEPAWRPIESAPKDGTHILAVLPDSDTCYVICWSDPKACIRSELGGEVDEIGWRVAFDGFLFASHEQPSYWMPLPEGPEATNG